MENMIRLCSMVQKRICVNFLKSKRLMSYLYVTGDRAREVYSSVQPHIDFEKRIHDISELECNMRKRRLDVDIGELKGLWEFYKTRLQHKQQLELNRKEIKLALEKLILENVNGSKDAEIDSLKLKFRLVRDDLKDITKTIWDIENNVVLKVLQIPNDVHERTPANEEIIGIYNEQITNGVDHVEVGKQLNCLDYRNKSSYFLKNDLALFEVVACEYFVNVFKSVGYIPTINTDFARSVLVEGCTLKSVAPDDAFVLKNTDAAKKDKLYLCGGASFLPFYGLHAKHYLEGGVQPACYVTSGKQYSPNPISHCSGLYSAWQSTAVQLFICAIPDEDLITLFDDTVQNVIDLYKSLDIHFRIVNMPAHELKPWETVCTSFQLYSPVNEKYIEVGNVSVIGDFISKRLQAHSYEDKQLQFLNVISGTVVRLPVLIGVLLETSSDSQLDIPKIIKELMIF